MRQGDIQRNPMFEAIMAGSSRIDRNISMLCTRYKFMPSKELALQSYSDSLA